MKKLLEYSIYVWFCFVIPILHAEQDNLRFHAIEGVNNLPKGVIRAIIRDNDGYMWFATNNGLSRFDGYKFVHFINNPEDSHSLSSDIITTLHLDINNQLWVGTQEHGLNLYQKSTSPFLRIAVNGLIYSISSNSEQLFVVTDKNFISIKKSVDTQSYHTTLFKNSLLNDPQFVIRIDNAHFLLATKNHIVKYNVNDGSFIKLLSFDQSLRVRQIVKSSKNIFFIATDKGLLEFNIKQLTLNQLNSELTNKRILAIDYTNDGLWASVFNDGIVKINKDKILKNYRENINDPDSLSYNTSTSLYYEHSGGLWIGGFSNGINQLPYLNTVFELYNNHSNLLSCLTSITINNIFQKGNDLFVATGNGLYILNTSLRTCKRAFSASYDNSTFYSFYNQDDKNILVGSNFGLFKLEFNNNSFQLNILTGSPQKSIYFIHPYSSNKLLLGTYDGVYLYDILNETFKLLKHPTISKKLAVYSVTADQNAELYFASNEGAIRLNNNLELQLVHFPQKNIPHFNFTSVVSDKNHLWFASESGEIVRVSQKDKSHEIIKLPKDDVQISATILDNNNNLWISSNRGLFKLNTIDNSFQIFNQPDGLQSDIFLLGSAFKANDGKMYFGGNKGFNAFYPDKIKLSFIPPKVVLTRLTHFNKEVIAGKDYNGFSIDTPIEYLDRLELSHRDYIISFEFAALHFADPSRNQYAYMLEGLHNEWIYTDAQHRTETFTNLAPGNYIFRVKAANKDGTWSLDKNNVALTIIVHPAPWFTWWAFTLYSLILVAIVLALVRYRIRSATKHAQALELEVIERTKKINTQKHLIESLLERKNELFANISHEFRTPLTLILGPLEKELKTLDSPKSLKRLSMMQRNASRLLSMIEQILKLAELKQEDTKKKSPHAVNPVLTAIVESFQPLAQYKSIDLNLQLDSDCTILASKDGLEVMVGNLISNAIKYTPKEGSILLGSKVTDKTLTIKVTDTGYGMPQGKLSTIFGRFVRLNETSDIAGTGIGLSIVEELIKSHNGQIKVSSKLKRGSSFSLILATTNQVSSDDSYSIKSIEHLIQIENITVTTENTPAKSKNIQVQTQQDTIMIIDDNPDMLQYIQNSLRHQYQCIIANRGDAGLKLAVKEIPDLIICDIMMPGIDGYEVARQLRNNLLTSHIPLVLLTAKDDTESRIQGWQENVDDYMTKPFDEAELCARIKNILSIRNILKNRVAEQFTASSKSNKKRFRLNQVNLNSLDKLFIQKLVKGIEFNYSDKNYASTQMASSMSMSSRQLQRKLNALVDKSPMVILRQYRLTKASEFLLEGKQVGVVADICGFNSLSYFSQCFKAEFGLTPQQYK